MQEGYIQTGAGLGHRPGGLAIHNRCQALFLFGPIHRRIGGGINHR